MSSIDSCSSVARHILDIASLSDDRIHQVLKQAHFYELNANASGPINNAQKATPQSLAGRTVALVFYEASTRTRVSFELAALQLGARVINIQGAASSATKGETLRDTMLTLSAMGVDCIVLRHPQNGAAAELAAFAPENMSIINAGDGINAHPSQALLDVQTLLSQSLSIPDSTLTIVGDLRHSRVARSNIQLWQRLNGKKIQLAGPEYFLPKAGDLSEMQSLGSVSTHQSFDEVLATTDVLMMLRIQKERIAGAKIPDPEQYHRDWCLTEERLEQLPSNAQILHPGPMNRGVEIDSKVADGERSLILKQVQHGVYTRMAMLSHCMHSNNS